MQSAGDFAAILAAAAGSDDPAYAAGLTEIGCTQGHLRGMETAARAAVRLADGSAVTAAHLHLALKTMGVQ